MINNDNNNNSNSNYDDNDKLYTSGNDADDIIGNVDNNIFPLYHFSCLGFMG